jgi:protein-S-isoprenylcysteine O-methyltransferase Ste14
MEYIKAFFLVWGTIVGLGTLAGLYKFRKSWDTGVAISGGVSLLYAVLTILSALDILILPVPNWWAWTLAPIGLVILVLSQVLSIWAARELKRNFSPKLSPVSEGNLVTTGPFRICRHPIMLAMLMSWIGTGIALDSITIFIAYGLVAILVMRRVALEEKFLEETYGEKFRAYKNEVSAIVPCLDPKSRAGQEVESGIELMKTSNWKNLMGICHR